MSAETSRIEVERLRREEADLRQRVKRLQTKLEQLDDLYKAAWRRLLNVVDETTDSAKEMKHQCRKCRHLEAGREHLQPQSRSRPLDSRTLCNKGNFSEEIEV